jgi:very-short-patch-repair endonuclease
VAKEWHLTKNKDLTPNDVTSGSNKKVWWKCSKGDDHEWESSVANRVKAIGCPYCTLTPQSKQELTITFELKQFFEINPKGFKTRVQGKLWSIDIFLSELNLGIEFDGSYWHKDKRALDKLKTEQLQDDGFKIMRIREEPLKPITDIDVVSKVPFNAKHVVNDILKYIMDAYTVDSKKIDLIRQYLRKRTLQNEQGLEDYIEQILTEKAERKKKK